MTDDQQRPASVSLAFILFLLQLVVAIGGLVVAVVIAQSQRTAESLGAGPVWDGSIALIVPVLELVVVFRMRSGRNWARIVLTVLGSCRSCSLSPRRSWGSLRSCTATAPGRSGPSSSACGW